VLWFASVVGKRLLIPGLNAITGSPWIATRAALQGALSAALELGATALYFAFFPRFSFAQVAAFGIGAGSAEAAYVLGLGLFGPRSTPTALNAWIKGARVSLCVRYSVAIERFFALLGHTGSRGLIYVGLYSSFPIAAGWVTVAVLLFALIDGVAVYGHLQNWNSYFVFLGKPRRSDFVHRSVRYGMEQRIASGIAVSF
jgi:hypothetical protein